MYIELMHLHSGNGSVILTVLRIRITLMRICCHFEMPIRILSFSLMRILTRIRILASKIKAQNVEKELK